MRAHDHSHERRIPVTRDIIALMVEQCGRVFEHLEECLDELLVLLNRLHKRRTSLPHRPGYAAIG